MMENGQRIKPNKDQFFPRDDAEFYKARCDELEARLARVEALPEKWRNETKLRSLATPRVVAWVIKTYLRCADELEEALKK